VCFLIAGERITQAKNHFNQSMTMEQLLEAEQRAAEWIRKFHPRASKILPTHLRPDSDDLRAATRGIPPRAKRGDSFYSRSKLAVHLHGSSALRTSPGSGACLESGLTAVTCDRGKWPQSLASAGTTGWSRAKTHDYFFLLMTAPARLSLAMTARLAAGMRLPSYPFRCATMR